MGGLESSEPQRGVGYGGMLSRIAQQLEALLGCALETLSDDDLGIELGQVERTLEDLGSVACVGTEVTPTAAHNIASFRSPLAKMVGRCVDSCVLHCSQLRASIPCARSS